MEGRGAILPPPLIEDSLNNPQAYEKIRIFA